MIASLAFSLLTLPPLSPSGLGGAEGGKLTPEDKDQLRLCRMLLQEIGDEVWPGFGAASPPLVLYDDQYEYLVGLPEVGEPWAPVAGDDLDGEPYHRRDADAPQAFAVRIGDTWAGRLNTLANMNQSMRAQLRQRMPDRFVEIAMKNMGIGPAQHAVSLLHESFHAFQATQAPGRFEAALDGYSVQRRYPDDESFAEDWSEEGAALIQAVGAQEEAEAVEFIREFLALRDNRRESVDLDPELVAYEQDLEWLEGLAQYVEERLREVAVTGQLEPTEEFHRALQRSAADLAVRTRRLGKLEGDTRFYLSGSAQARLLDRWFPGWKDLAFEQSPEELLRLLVED